MKVEMQKEGRVGGSRYSTRDAHKLVRKPPLYKIDMYT